MFDTSIDHIASLYDRFGRQMGLDASDARELDDWRGRVRERLREILGFSKMEAAPLDEKLLSETAFDGFTKRVVSIQVEPGVRMPMDLFLPDKPNGAAILNPHGHGGGRESTAGTDETIALALGGEGKLPFPAIMARRGYVVACPDARGAGMRREKNAQNGDPRANSHDELLKLGVCFGIAPIGWMVWDLMRLADYVLTLPGVDRLGCAGMSGGGQQTLYFAAMDDRCRAAMLSGYFYGFKNALLEQPENCPCNYAPHLYETIDMGDLGAMIAPRPLYIETGRNDPLNGTLGLANVLPQVEIARHAYALKDAEDCLIHRIHDGGHVWVAEDVPEFFDRVLGDSAE